METFTHFKITETKQGIEVIIYMNQQFMEISNELGQASEDQHVNIEKEAVDYVKRKLPSLKVSTVKVMVGAILLSTIGMGTLTFNTAQASSPETTQAKDRKTTHTVISGDTLSGIAAKYGTTIDAIKMFNQLTSDIIKIGQILTIPTGTNLMSDEILSLNSSNIPNAYSVVSGDTLSAIAKRNGTTADAIKQANNLTSDFLQIGQTLTIPNGTNHQTVNSSVDTGAYKVVSGDTLSAIAKRNGTTADAIKQTNNLTSDFLQIGQTLIIPTGANHQTVNSTVNTGAYKVVSGDTLSAIAKRNGTTVTAIKQANNLTSDFLRIGQTLILPAPVNPSDSRNSVIQETAVNQEDLHWLAKMIYSEARGESLEGQIAVGAVIVNRVKSPLFPNTVKEVLFQISNGYYQFTPAQTGTLQSATPNQQNVDAALRALTGEDPTGGSLYFYNSEKTSSKWLKSRSVSTVIGNHTFAY